MEPKRIRVAISHGDINGISYEVILKALANEQILELFTPVIYGSGRVAAYWRTKLELESVSWHQIQSARDAVDGMINLINCTHEDLKVEPGEATEAAGLAAFMALERAVADVQAGLCQVLVTAPINKSVMPADKFPYSGHTQYLQAKAAREEGRSIMLLCARECRVGLVTEHIPVSEVPARLSIELICDKVRLLEATLKRDFGINKPRIAVLALNPHAGDRGLIGREEEEIINPAIAELQDRGVIVFGPYAADGFWGSDRMDSFDAVVAMYHDQGLAPFKALYMNEGVNITLGLEFVRTSPDHGTGYDIAGQGLAREDSLREAIYLAIDCYRARRRYDEATRNPLRRIYHNKGHEDEKIDLRAEDEY